MCKYNRVTIFRNETDKREIDRKLGEKFPFTIGRIWEEAYPPCYRDRSYEETPIFFNKLRKKFLIYGYVYVIRSFEYDYYGGECSDIEKCLGDEIDLGGRFWIADRDFRWCFEFEYSDILLYISPYSRINDLLKWRTWNAP